MLACETPGPDMLACVTSDPGMLACETPGPDMLACVKLGPDGHTGLCDAGSTTEGTIKRKILKSRRFLPGRVVPSLDEPQD